MSLGFNATRTTRTPAFWGYPPPPHDYPYYWVILDPKSKEDKVKVTNLKNLPKFQILIQMLHATHLLKLLDKMCKYEMDPMSIVEDTEQTLFCPQTDRRTMWNQYTPLSTLLKLGYNKEAPPSWPYPHEAQANHGVSIDQSHRFGRHRAACHEPAGSYDKATRPAICFEHKTQYLLIRAPYTRIVVFWHIGNIHTMISQSQISCDTSTFYIAAIFVKYCYTTGSWLL